MADFSLLHNNPSSSSSFSKSNTKSRRTGDRHREATNRSSIAVVELEHLGLPLLSAATASPADSLHLRPRRRYSIGRSRRRSDFLFADRRVGRRHCQILFDPRLRRIYIQEPRARASLNGVFVNGVRIVKGGAVELSAGDEVSLICANRQCRRRGGRVGFVVLRIVFEEKVMCGHGRRSESQSQSQSQSQGTVSSRQGFKRVFASKIGDEFAFSFSDPKCEDLIARANRLVDQCKDMLRSDSLDVQNHGVVSSETAPMDNDTEKLPFDSRHSSSDGAVKRKISAPGKKFCLNRLGFMEDDGSSGHDTASVSLQELLHPVETISQMFIATFTSDILWFLSSCEIPRHLPVAVACHNTERCWNSSPEKRTSVPYADFPRLIVVYPPFPEDIAFGKDLKKPGIGCHHPKLFVLQRDDFLRVIVTSANLVPSQWNAVTNTIWWQDFPCRSSPDLMPLFTQIHTQDINQESKSDFCSQLAGFMASLLTDVPSQAHWILELTKYNFGGAMADLVASVPGIHSYAPSTFSLMYSLHGASMSSRLKFLGSVEASVVGLSYLFHKAADSNGAQLKKLASFLGKSSESAYGFAKVVLKRNKSIPADENAVSILVPSPNEFPSEDSVQLGFLPRKVAKWVGPLWDIGFFKFSAYVCQKQALLAALGGSNKRVSLSIHVSQGPNFEDITKLMKPAHVVALCSMVAAIQRCTGLWRLQEVLARYRWPEQLESDFIYSASSIGSINARFLAAFSAAAGKTSLQFDSEESDPEWGCWSASQELKNPSIRILFPTINRVQNACNGVFPSKRILCFSERTWERLQTVDILHDAIPHPRDRVGYPMHIKVARRRFKSRTDKSSFGWVYCGSHNFSAAAWGRPIPNSNGTEVGEKGRPSSSLGLRLHVCNYELGIVFIFPPTELKSSASKSSMDLDSIVMPFVVPAPKYGPRDRPATARAVREALAVLTERGTENLSEVEEIPDEDESAEETSFVAEEKEEEKAYANMLWNQIDLS